MTDRLQAFVGLVWMIGFLVAGVWAFVDFQIALGFGCVVASLALPLVLPAMHDEGVR